MNTFPQDLTHTLTGFGGNPSLNQAQHRAAITRTPILLVHGNAANSVDLTFGMQKMKDFLKEAGYQRGLPRVGIIHGARENGDFLWYRYDGRGESDRSGNLSWRQNSGNAIGNGW